MKKDKIENDDDTYVHSILLGIIVLHFVPVAFAIGSIFMAMNGVKLWWLAAIFATVSLVYLNSKYHGKVK